MPDTIIVALITSVATLAGVFLTAWKTNNLVNYRVDQLEKKVSEHNGIGKDLLDLAHNTDVRFERSDQRITAVESGLLEVKRKIGA